MLLLLLFQLSLAKIFPRPVAWVDHPLYTCDQLQVSGKVPSELSGSKAFRSPYNSSPKTMAVFRQISIPPTLSFEYELTWDSTTTQFDYRISYDGLRAFQYFTIRFMSFSPSQLVAEGVRPLALPVVVFSNNLQSQDPNLKQYLQISTVAYNTSQFSSQPRLIMAITALQVGMNPSIIMLQNEYYKIGVDPASIITNQFTTSFRLQPTGGKYNLQKLTAAFFVISLPDILFGQYYGIYMDYTYSGQVPAYQQSHPILYVNYQGDSTSFIGSFYKFYFQGISAWSVSYSVASGSQSDLSALTLVGAKDKAYNRLAEYSIGVFIPVKKKCYEDMPWYFESLCYDECPPGSFQQPGQLSVCIKCVPQTCRKLQVLIREFQTGVQEAKYQFTLYMDFPHPVGKDFPPITVLNELKQKQFLVSAELFQSELRGEFVITKRGQSTISFCFSKQLIFLPIVLENRCAIVQSRLYLRPRFQFRLFADNKAGLVNSFYMLFSGPFLANFSNPQLFTVYLGGNKVEISYFYLYRTIFFQLKNYQPCISCQLRVVVEQPSLVLFRGKYPLEQLEQTARVARLYRSQMPQFITKIVDNSNKVMTILQNTLSVMYLLGLDCYVIAPLHMGTQLYLLSRTNFSLHHSLKSVLNSTSPFAEHLVPSLLMAFLREAEFMTRLTDRYLYFNHLFTSILPVVIIWLYLIAALLLRRAVFQFLSAKTFCSKKKWQAILGSSRLGLHRLCSINSAQYLVFFFVARQLVVQFQFDLSVFYQILVSCLAIQIILASTFLVPLLQVRLACLPRSHLYSGLMLSRKTSPLLFFRGAELLKAISFAMLICYSPNPLFQGIGFVLAQTCHLVAILPNRVYLRSQFLHLFKEIVLLLFIWTFLGVTVTQSTLPEDSAAMLGAAQVLLAYAVMALAVAESLSHFLHDIYKAVCSSVKPGFKILNSEKRVPQNIRRRMTISHLSVSPKRSPTSYHSPTLLR